MKRAAAFLLLAAWAAAGAAEPDPPKTVITGDRMNILDQGDAVEFTGGVKMVRGDDTLTADRMVSDEKNKTVRAWGRVHWRRDVPLEGIRWDVWGDEGFFDSANSSGTLRGKRKQARVRRSPLNNAPGGVLTLRSNLVRLFPKGEDVSGRVPWVSSATVNAVNLSSETSSAEAIGKVYVTYVEGAPQPRETEMWCDRALYDGAVERVSLWQDKQGMARLRQVEGRDVRNLTGRLISYFPKEERLVVERDVTAVVFSPDKGESLRGAPR